ncbi:MAG: hypothetical protein ACC628_12330 [Pirellulaceae bacterium]
MRLKEQNDSTLAGGDDRMEPIRLAKRFKYENCEEAKGAVFQGALFADEKALYLVHNSHAWESAATATAAFGLLGALIHHLCTRKKTVRYPFLSLPVSEMEPSMRERLGMRSFKETAEVSIIPKEDVLGYSKSMMSGSKFQVGDIEIVLLSPSAKAMKQLAAMGYSEL